MPHIPLADNQLFWPSHLPKKKLFWPSLSFFPLYNSHFKLPSINAHPCPLKTPIPIILFFPFCWVCVSPPLVYMTTGAAAPGDGVFRCVFDGSIAGCDTGIERRPYHRNCSCALHKSRNNCSHGWQKSKVVSYPMRRAWSEGCLALAASVNSSPSSSPASVGKSSSNNHQLGSCEEEEEVHHQGFRFVLWWSSRFKSHRDDDWVILVYIFTEWWFISFSLSVLKNNC